MEAVLQQHERGGAPRKSSPGSVASQSPARARCSPGAEVHKVLPNGINGAAHRADIPEQQGSGCLRLRGSVGPARLMFRKKPSGFFWSTFFKRGAGGCSFLPVTRPAAPSGSAAVGAAPPPQRGCHRHHRVSCSPGTGTGRLDGFASSNCGLDARRYVPQSLHRGTRKVYNCDCDCLICGAAGLLLGSKRLSARRSSFLSRSPLSGFFLFFLFFFFGCVY